MVLLLTATFHGKCAATLEGLRRSPSVAVELTAVSRPDTGINSQSTVLWRLIVKKRRSIRKRKGEGIYKEKFIYRNGKAA